MLEPRSVTPLTVCALDRNMQRSERATNALMLKSELRLRRHWRIKAESSKAAL